MKVSDFIVEYLISKGITDVFGYPGGMVTHLMDSLKKYEKQIKAHVVYHEQGAAFAACGYAQVCRNVGVAYATSGPGATNLITGICNAFFDSIPTLFITGQVNTYEKKGEYEVRQRGFQETDIVTMVRGVTKYAERIEDAYKIKWYLDYAWFLANSGRKGPVLLDIPMNIFRAEIEINELEGFEPEKTRREGVFYEIVEALEQAKRPVLLVGNGIKISNTSDMLQQFLEKTSIPMVTSMIAVDVLPKYSYGFVGAYGTRTANFIIAKSDLVISLGARLDVRQVGARREQFAPNAKIIRVDIDAGELQYKVHKDEISINADLCNVLAYLSEQKISGLYNDWIQVCDCIRKKTKSIDDQTPNRYIKTISRIVPEDAIITTDVGQNQVWVAQSFDFKRGQEVLFSGGHGAMGYSLPAAIGCAMTGRRKVVSFNGDGGIQMNIQELQTVVREKLPISIVVLNNSALGMIRHFQEMYFEDNEFQTVSAGGYTVPDFKALAEAYGLSYYCIDKVEDFENLMLSDMQFIEIKFNDPTYVFPKLEFGKPNQDQEPLLDRCLYKEIMEL